MAIFDKIKGAYLKNKKKRKAYSEYLDRMEKAHGGDRQAQWDLDKKQVDMSQKGANILCVKDGRKLQQRKGNLRVENIIIKQGIKVQQRGRNRRGPEEILAIKCQNKEECLKG